MHIISEWAGYLCQKEIHNSTFMYQFRGIRKREKKKRTHTHMASDGNNVLRFYWKQRDSNTMDQMQKRNSYA